MANTAEMTDGRRGPAPAWPAPRARLALTRNEVMRETLGGRTWLGALTNLGDHACAGLTVRIRFLDDGGRVAGSPLSARTDGLEPGARLHLQARLPEAASALEIVTLRWTAAGRTIDRPPAGPCPLGAVRA